MIAMWKCFKNVKIKAVDVRLWCYGLACVNLLTTAFVTLTTDLSRDPDPRVRGYMSVRWKLITCWFNMILLFYQPLCLYCDWCEKKGEEPPNVQTLRGVRDVVFTAILFPIITYSDLVFWVLFLNCPDVIAPPIVFKYLSIWSQHSLHTVSMIVLIMDLLFTPRKPPTSKIPRLAFLLGFASVYFLMLLVCRLNGEYVYSVLENSDNIQWIILYLIFISLTTCFYYIQWPVIEYLWGYKGTRKSDKRRL